MYGTQELAMEELKLRKVGKKKRYKKWLDKNQKNLFDFENEDS